jgi:DNA-binding MurR/RpiR family transcriptional regulator
VAARRPGAGAAAGPRRAPDDLFARLRARGADLSPGQRRVADHLIAHPQDAAFQSAAEVAAAVGVSESLVVRFAAALGYRGYPGLVQELQGRVRARASLPERLQRRPTELTARTPARDVWAAVAAQDQANLAATLADASSSPLEEVVAALLAARTIHVVGLRGSAHLAGLFGLLLDKAGADVRVRTSGDVTLFDQLRSLGGGDVLVAFSFARYTRRTIEALRLARGRGATTVAVTDAVTAPAVAEADLSLHVQVASASFQHSYAAVVSLLNALVVAWTLRAPERTMRSLEALEDVLPQGEFLG